MERRDWLKLGLAGVTAMAVEDKAWALKYYPRPSDKKWAVLYATWCGTARDAGVWISEGMGGIANVFDLRENPDLKGYDHIVIGSAIRYTIHPDLKKYIEESRDWLKKKIQGLYVVCGNMGQLVGPKQREDFIDNQLAKICGVSNVPSKALDGRMTKALVELPDVVEEMKKAGLPDWDNLKRSDCLEFGKLILDSTKR